MILTISFEGKYEGKTDEELQEILEQMKEETAGKYAYGEEEVDLRDFSDTGVKDRVRKQRETEILWLENKLFMGDAIELAMD